MTNNNHYLQWDKCRKGVETRVSILLRKEKEEKMARRTALCALFDLLSEKTVTIEKMMPTRLSIGSPNLAVDTCPNDRENHDKDNNSLSQVEIQEV